MPEPSLLTADQVADLLNLKPHAVNRLARRGELPCVMLGRWRRFRPADVEAFVAARASGHADAA